MRIFFELALIFLLLLLDLLAGNVGLSLLLPLYAALYYYETVNWSHGNSAVLVAGIGLDLMYMRPLYFTTVVLLIALMIGHIVSTAMHRSVPLAPLAAGAAAGATGCAGNHFGAAWCGQVIIPAEFIIQVGASILFGAVFMLLLVVILDHFGTMTGMDCYRDIKLQRKKKVIRSKTDRGRRR